jgi:hypothetical protein
VEKNEFRKLEEEEIPETWEERPLYFLAHCKATRSVVNASAMLHDRGLSSGEENGAWRKTD